MLYSLVYYLHLYHVGNMVGTKFVDLYREIHSLSFLETKCYISCHKILLSQYSSVRTLTTIFLHLH